MGGSIVVILGVFVLATMFCAIRQVKGTEDVLKDLLSSRTIFALIIYGTFALLSIKGKIDANIISNALFALMSYYFGYQSGKSTQATQQNGGVK